MDGHHHLVSAPCCLAACQRLQHQFCVMSQNMRRSTSFHLLVPRGSDRPRPASTVRRPDLVGQRKAEAERRAEAENALLLQRIAELESALGVQPKP